MRHQLSILCKVIMITKIKKCKKLINKDSSKCCVEGFLQDTMIGTITGISGIEVKDEHVNRKLHKYPRDEYQKS